MFARIRSLAVLLVVAVLCVFAVHRPPVAHTTTMAVRQSIPLPHSKPSSSRQVPVDFLAIGAAVGATKKKVTRKSAGKKRDMPMFLDSDVHVMREDPLDPRRKITTIVRGGRMLDDLEDDALTDDEVDELTARRVLRPATPAEVERANQTDKAIRREELVADQTTEIQQLRANREGERAALIASGVKPEDLIAFDGDTSEKVADLQTAHAEAVAKLDAE
jgi:hypothetical protein